MENLKLWKKFLEVVKLKLSTANYKAFFSKAILKSIDDEKVILLVPSAFIKETLNQRHLQLIEDTFEIITGKKLKIEFLISAIRELRENDEENFFQPIEVKTSYLNPKFTLENFVVGPTNNVAYAGALAVADNPGHVYNPFFIYGGTGVGKTHLMLGIGNAILTKRPAVKIIYSPSDKFMNDYVEAIQNHKMVDLRKKYRSPDVLLIDDIQFFSGREGTQEEFFHTFNELMAKNSQIILTSDRSPHEISKLEDRLKSRFAGGLMIDIQQPDFDTRIAILRAKCFDQKVSFPEETLRLLAGSSQTNIRELEGKLVGILQTLRVMNLQPTPENVSRFLQIPKKNINIEPKAVLEAVCSHFNLNEKDLIGPKRQKELVLPRHITMFILSQLNMTVERIGQILGKRDHTTVMHGREKIKKLIETDSEVQRTVTEIRNKLST